VWRDVARSRQVLLPSDPMEGVTGMDLSCAEWRKSTLSSAGNCLEVTMADDRIAIRDSKDRNGPILLFSLAEWETFLGAVRRGDLRPALPSETTLG
jgi:hypothetical protein